MGLRHITLLSALAVVGLAGSGQARSVKHTIAKTTRKVPKRSLYAIATAGNLDSFTFATSGGFANINGIFRIFFPHNGDRRRPMWVYEESRGGGKSDLLGSGNLTDRQLKELLHLLNAAHFTIATREYVRHTSTTASTSRHISCCAAGKPCAASRSIITATPRRSGINS